MLKRLALPLFALFCLALPAQAAERAPASKTTRAPEEPRPPLKAGKVPLPPKSSVARPAPKPVDRSFISTATLNGLWKADAKRTADLFGDEAAARVAKDPNVLLEFDTIGKHYRAWQDAKKSKALVDIPLQSIELKGSKVVLTNPDGKDFSVEILDADTLILLDNDAVLVRAGR